MGIRRLREITDQEKEKIIEIIKGLLIKHEEIIFGLLYGSFIDANISRRFGDIDLAIYIKENHLISPSHVLESNIEAEAYSLLSSHLSKVIPIEVVVLNSAPYSFITRLFKGRYLVLKDDEEVLTDFIEEVGLKAIDNLHLKMESIRELIGE